jgi:serine/threonine protein kinase
MAIAHVNKRPEPPSARAAQPVPADLDRLILRCLEKDPAKRPQSASEVAAALTALASDFPWSSADAERWWLENVSAESGNRQLAAPATLDTLLLHLKAPGPVDNDRCGSEALRSEHRAQSLLYPPVVLFAGVV